MKEKEKINQEWEFLVNEEEKFDFLNLPTNGEKGYTYRKVKTTETDSLYEEKYEIFRGNQKGILTATHYTDAGKINKVKYTYSSENGLELPEDIVESIKKRQEEAQQKTVESKGGFTRMISRVTEEAPKKIWSVVSKLASAVIKGAKNSLDNPLTNPSKYIVKPLANLLSKGNNNKTLSKNLNNNDGVELTNAISTSDVNTSRGSLQARSVSSASVQTIPSPTPNSKNIQRDSHVVNL